MSKPPTAREPPLSYWTASWAQTPHFSGTESALSAAKNGAAHADSPAHPERSAAEPKDADEEPFDKEVWDGIIAELKQLEEDGVITPDPNPPKLNYTYYGPPDGYVIPPEVAAEEAAKFRADIALRVERQKQWPEIEERRRKKLAPDLSVTQRRRSPGDIS